MKIQRWLVVGLIALNALLLTAFLFRTTHESTAYAQARSRGSYITLPGHVGGKMVFFVLDATSGRLVVLSADPGAKRVTPIAAREAAKDLDQAFNRK